MPILPLIDLLILMGSGSLLVGFALKSIEITTHYHPEIFGFSTIDFVLMAGVCMGFALTLAARTWVKLNEPKLLGRARSAVWTTRNGRELQNAAPPEDFEDEAEPPATHAATGARVR